jgi:hypothetical protein
MSPDADPVTVTVYSIPAQMVPHAMPPKFRARRPLPAPRVTRWTLTQVSERTERFSKTVTATAALQKWSAFPGHRGVKLNRSAAIRSATP